jgi:hypothetical protein
MPGYLRYHNTGSSIDAGVRIAILTQIISYTGVTMETVMNSPQGSLIPSLNQNF